MRDIYKTGVLTELTQGSIINNCISEDFRDCKVWGCVITPRCDLANEGKVSTFHYLPVIDFANWVDKVFREMLREEYYANLRGKINQKLESAGAGKNVMNVFETQAQILQLANAIIKPKELPVFLTTCHQYFDRDSEAEKDYLRDERHYKKILTDLLSNGIHGYYLLESWENVDNFKIVIQE